MARKHEPKPAKIISCRNNKVTVFEINLTNSVGKRKEEKAEELAIKLGYLSSLLSIVEGCEKYPLLLKPILLEKMHDKKIKKSLHKRDKNKKKKKR